MKTATTLLVILLTSLAFAANGPANQRTGPRWSVVFSRPPCYPVAIQKAMARPANFLEARESVLEPWILQATGLPMNYSVAFLRVLDSNTVWAIAHNAYGPSRVFIRTTNGGATWMCDSIRSVPSTCSFTGIHALSASDAWACMFDFDASAGGGIFHTTDGGTSWKKDPVAFSTSPKGADIIHFFDDSNAVCIGEPIGDRFEIYTTADGGGTWSRVPPANIPPRVLYEFPVTGGFAASGNTIWVTGTYSNRCFQSTDMGKSWCRLSYPDSAMDYYTMLLTFQSDNVGLSSSHLGDIKKTSDGGVTWFSVSSPPNTMFQYLEYVPHTAGMYVGTFDRWAPSLVDQWIAGSACTTDGGLSWTVLNTWPDTVFLPLGFSSPNSGWCATENDNIRKWVPIPFSGRVAAVHPDSLSFLTREAGVASDTVTVDFVNHGTDPVTLTTIVPPGPNFTVVRQPNLPVEIPSLASINVGVRFTPQENASLFDSLIFVSNASNSPRTALHLEGRGIILQPARADTLYAVSSSSLFSLNLTSGTLREIGPLGCSILSALTIRPSNGQIYAVSITANVTTLYRICSASAYAVTAVSFPIGNLRGIAFSPNGSLYGASRLGRLYRLILATGDTVGIGTAPGVNYGWMTFSPTGKLWVSGMPSSTGKDRIYTVDTTTGQATLVGATGDGTYTKGLFISPGGTLCGLKGGGNQYNSIISIDTLTGAGTIVCILSMTDVAGLAMVSTGPLVGISLPVQTPTVTALEQNYPNPFNPRSKIRYQLSDTRHVRLTVYDLLGRIVAVLVDENKPAGTYEVEFYGSGLASGVYLCRMEAGSYTAIKKLLMIK